MYPIIRIGADAPEAIEPLGTKDKFWYGGQRFLFKQVRRGTGEDWSEKIAAEIAELLGLPHAGYDLAEWITESQNIRGVRSLNFCPAGTALILGNELLVETDPEYASGAFSKYRVPAHTVQRVMSDLISRNPALPLGWMPPSFVAASTDVFIGYLLLDALIGNTDRHHENWGFTRTSAGRFHLAPTFDHASSLGRNLLDEERQNDYEREIKIARSTHLLPARLLGCIEPKPTGGRSRPSMLSSKPRCLAPLRLWAGLLA